VRSLDLSRNAPLCRSNTQPPGDWLWDGAKAGGLVCCGLGRRAALPHGIWV
jgi:hypothetical protein